MKTCVFISILVSVFITCSAQRKLIRLPIPFVFLITRNSTNFVTSMDKKLSTSDNQYFQWFCKDVDCFFAVFNNTGSLYFQLLRNTDNDGSYTDSTFGLLFRKSQYLYTLAAVLYSNDPQRCSGPSIYSNLTVPKCPAGWISYRRSNGRIYCYYLTDRMSRAQGFKACAKASKGANITGFQTDNERTFLSNTLFNLTTDWYIHIAAERYDYTTCLKKYPEGGSDIIKCYKSQFYWYKGITLSGKPEVVSFRAGDNIDGVPAPAYCLQLVRTGILDDNYCETPHAALCGKYADLT